MDGYGIIILWWSVAAVLGAGCVRVTATDRPWPRWPDVRLGDCARAGVGPRGQLAGTAPGRVRWKGSEGSEQAKHTTR